MGSLICGVSTASDRGGNDPVVGATPLELTTMGPVLQSRNHGGVRNVEKLLMNDW